MMVGLCGVEVGCIVYEAAITWYGLDIEKNSTKILVQ
jgi:hypothetical protein